jgi:GT2 family glycosyltransferase
MTTAAVAIGRNEGDRLLACLTSLKGRAFPVVYVDSGSTDGSVDVAHAAGVDVVCLDMSVPFTAARARNAGLERVKSIAPDVVYVQFLDSDCEMDADWIEAGRTALQADQDLAVVSGWRQEKFPRATLWNNIVDAEWNNGTAGEVKACGGDALIRVTALESVGGYREDLIAGEEPEMCLRMRAKGWRILRLDVPMTRHDADLTRFGQWWQRGRRTGHAYAQGVALHGKSPERYRVRELSRTVAWGFVLPFLTLVGALLVSPWALLLLLAYPLQVLRLHLTGTPLVHAVFTVLGKLPELQGAFGYWFRPRRILIEYK